MLKKVLFIFLLCIIPIIYCSDNSNSSRRLDIDTLLICNSIEDTTTNFNHDCPYCDYIAALGYTIEGSEVVFPDDSRCDVWSFYRGECGQQWSYCEQQGYELINIQEDMGTWTSSYAVCQFDDSSRCLERLFWLDLCQPYQCSTYTQLEGCCDWVIDTVEIH